MPVDRRTLWPDLADDRILFEDEHLIAVDKPAGVPSQAADPSSCDDLPHRLALRLGGGAPGAYVGIHQRLDRDTSGAILYTKRREANPGLARQLEGRTVEKVYLAAVEGWPGGRRLLRDRLVKGEGGRRKVTGPRDGRGEEAISRVREVARRGPRALLEVRIETGRTHQIRVQLAHAGAPVAGDALYGGPPASRLMLHARALALVHPVTGAPLRIEAPAPPELERWLEDGTIRFPQDDAALDRALRAAAEARWGLARAAEAPEPTTAFRLAHGAADGLPGLAVDVYGDFLVAHLSDESLPRDRLLDALDRLGLDGVYLKLRPRQTNELADTRREDLAPAHAVRGRDAPEEMEVREHGVPYLVRLGDGLGTGIFLDQRDNRRRVRDLSPGRRVLNLFAYTCPFTVAAAVGGARSTVSVDVSAPALAQGRRNVEHACPGGDHRFERADVFHWLERAARAGERFDLVIVDPPTHSTTRRGRWTSGKGWIDLAAAALRLLAPDGRLLACSNDGRMSRQAFRRHLHEAHRRAGLEPRPLRDLPPPPDFPGSPPHLKTIYSEIRRSSLGG